MPEKEYIEREALQNKAFGENHPTFYDGQDIADWYEKCINETPAADVAPVRHGRWKKSKGNERPTENGFVHDDRYFCDCCGWGCCCDTKLDFRYCPKCGAKMDGGEGE